MTTLERIVMGEFDVNIPDSIAAREAKVIARHVLELIEREVDWVERGVHPWRAKIRTPSR
jgi:hypothetical protein